MQHRSEPATTRRPAPGRQPVVLVAGCGFGGLATLKELSRGCQVIVLDRNIYTTFQPLFYQVATAGLAPSDVAYSLRATCARSGARFRPARGVDIRLGSAIKEVGPGAILLARDERLPSDLPVWAAGVQSPETTRRWAWSWARPAGSWSSPICGCAVSIGSSRSATLRSARTTR